MDTPEKKPRDWMEILRSYLEKTPHHEEPKTSRKYDQDTPGRWSKVRELPAHVKE